MYSIIDILWMVYVFSCLLALAIGVHTCKAVCLRQGHLHLGEVILFVLPAFIPVMNTEVVYAFGKAKVFHALSSLKIASLIVAKAVPREDE
jgi:hypothetical protein